MRNLEPLSLVFRVKDIATTLEFKVTTPDLETAHEMMQDLASYFKIWELETKASFPSLTANLLKINEDID